MANVVRSHRVYVKQLWSADWTLVDQLYADSVTFCCSPEMPEALLYWNYGFVKPYNDAVFQVRQRIDYLDYYCKVEIDQPGDAVITWYGIIKEETNARRGARANNEDSGQLFLKAYGLEWLLERQQLTTSWVLDTDLTDKEINRCIGFNMGAGDERSARFVGNMSTVAGAKNAFVFCDTFDNAQAWTAYAVVDYLLTYQSPKDINGFDLVPFVLDPNFSQALLSLEWWKLQIAYEGRTLKELLDSIMHRNRLLSYKIAVAGNEIRIQPFTFTEQQIVLPSGNTIQAAQTQTTLNYDNSALTAQCVVVRDTQPTYDLVTARSERVGVVFTANNATDTPLESDWSSTLASDYNGGAPAADNTSDSYVKAMLHRNYRVSDKFERVWRYFRIPTDWDGTTAAGEPVMVDQFTVNNLVAVDPAKFWRPGLRIEPYLPLRTDIDYEAVSSNPSDATPNGSLPEYRRPFAVHFKSQTQRAYYLDRPESAVTLGSLPEQGERLWAVNVRPQEEGFGVILDVRGAPQHVIASADFTPTDTTDTEDWAGEIDWRDIFVTVYALTDDYARESWPTPPPALATEIARHLYLDIPGKRKTWLVPNTIVEIDSSGSLVRSNGGWIENDSEELQDLARLTYDWYSRERRAIDLTLRTLDADVRVGYLVTTIGENNTLLTCNSVVTRLSFDLRDNSHSVFTQYAELDLRGL